ncbi:MAG: fibrobacter succinogenes major paralogous domain-containing protein [Paludibacter sp.]|nr:fibrobacter succinogenes major paralogous domain-containing protein [Paludibacter sp.]
MNKTKILSFLFLLVLTLIVSSCNSSEPIQLITDDAIAFNPKLTYGKMTDIDGNQYHTITIGNQTWMASNLRVTKYQNGDDIQEVTNNNDWSTLTTGAQCTCLNLTDPVSISKYGRMYNYYAVSDSRNIAPLGWHVASETEWLSLTSYLTSHLGTSLSVAKALASTTDWALSEDSDTTAIGNNTFINNSSGFTALPCGKRTIVFFDFHIYGGWWTSTAGNDLGARCWNLYIGETSVEVNGGNYSYRHDGLSVRCIKD